MTDTTPRRSTYLEPVTTEVPIDPPTEPSSELRQTIAETRAAMTADLQARLDEAEAIIRQKQEIIDSMSVELAELHEAITELHETPNGVDTQVYNYVPEGSDGGEDTGYTVVQIDTESSTGKIRVYVNDGVVYDGDPEQPESRADDADARAMSFFTQVEKHLSTYDAGAQAVLAEVQRRTPIERAGYIKSLERIADVMQESTDRLRDHHQRAQIADHMVTGL